MGSAKTRVLVAEILKGEKNPKIIGVGESDTEGIKHGYITNVSLASESIRKAVEMAEKSSELKIKKASIALGGFTLLGEKSSGSSIVSKADGEVTFLDIEKAIEDAENNLKSDNKKIIKTIPLLFKLDGQEVLGDPEGMKGTKLEIDTLFITYSSQHFEKLLDALTEIGVEPIEIIPANYSASDIVLSKKDKMLGAVLVNIGSHTLTVSVFENEKMISLQTFPIGSSSVINDIALGMKVSLEKAEDFLFNGVDSSQTRKKLEEIIEARVSDFFTVVTKHLRKVNRNEVLPAGAVFIGGGSKINNLEKMSTDTLSLPSRIGITEMFNSSTKTKLRDPSWFCVLGLLNAEKDNYDYSNNSYAGLWKNIKNTIKSSIKQLMP